MFLFFLSTFSLSLFYVYVYVYSRYGHDRDVLWMSFSRPSDISFIGCIPPAPVYEEPRIIVPVMDYKVPIFRMFQETSPTNPPSLKEGTHEGLWIAIPNGCLGYLLRF